MEQKNKLYVGNLDYSVTEDDLRALFMEFGSISEVNMITEGGRPKGFAFVTFEEDVDAEAAAKELDGKDLKDRPLKVSIARPREER